MKKYTLLFLACCPILLFAQDSNQRQEVIRTIETIFDSMRAGDSSAIRQVFTPEARLQTTFIDKEGNPQISEGSIDRWLQGVAQPKEKVWDEKIWSYEVQIDQNLATVWTDYTFYLGDEVSHCGVNAFQLFRSKDGWKVFQITDTRRQEKCRTVQDELKETLNDLIDDWHIAAALADEDAFFGAMTPDAVYIGTDASERWQRDELRDWSKEYFDKESAWDFKPMDRHLQIADDGNSAWWDEKLDTWMGICRGSGILVKTSTGWKIRHFHLSVTVPNDKIQEFVGLVKE